MPSQPSWATERGISGAFKSLAEVQELLPSQEPLNPRQLGTVSNFFEVHGRLRLLDRVLEERSLVQRKGRDVNVLQHERVSVTSPSAI